MEISALTLKLIILLIPGVVAAKVYYKLTIHHKLQSDFMFVIVAIIFGIFSYIFVQLLFICFSLFYCYFNDRVWSLTVIDAFKKISDQGIIPYTEIIVASAVGLTLSFLAARCDDRKTLFKFARFFNVSTKYGDENLYSYFLNSPDTNFVYVRDIENSLTYLGWVRIFSENSEFKELVLEDVTVYDYPESNELYEIQRIYLCLKKDRIIIEQAKINGKS